MTEARRPTHPTVHVLMVHGVGGHDHLSNLLRTYQSYRANLTSVEPPVMGEDQIPGWRLTHFEEGATPPFLTLEPRAEPPPGSVGAVRMYEVNYSNFAGVVRRNHRIDLTNLFLGLDLAVCAARLRLRHGQTSVFGGDTLALGGCLQRFASVLTAGTVPIIGLPSLLFKNYLGTFIATFTRFFEDVATFALDKNGEQLISAHMDRTLDAIYKHMRDGDRLVVAAHSLGSMVVHNCVVRQWPTTPARFPETIVTFGSPIGLLMWGWLFLDFQDMDFRRRISADTYFCWNPISSSKAARAPLRWINVVNCVDPIATAFPPAAIDLSVDETDVRAGLAGGAVLHRFFGPAGVRSLGGAHSEYLNDKRGFLKILLRAAGLSPGAPEDVAGTRTSAEHWQATATVLHRAQWILLGAAWAFGLLYCALIARAYQSPVAFVFAILFAWPGLTIGVFAFFQRLILGGPTKRITPALIREMRWKDLAAFPYRLRASLLAKTDKDAQVNPMTPSPGYATRLIIKGIAFLPTLVMMLVPVGGTAWWLGAWPSTTVWQRLWTFQTALALVFFMGYVMSCAGHELIRIWRKAIRAVGAGAH